MSESKTARASAVKDTTVKKVISDPELIRLLRIDRASGIYPTTQGSDALLRFCDALLAENSSLTDAVNAQDTLIMEVRADKDALIEKNARLTKRLQQLDDANDLAAAVSTASEADPFAADIASGVVEVTDAPPQD